MGNLAIGFKKFMQNLYVLENKFDGVPYLWYIGVMDKKDCVIYKGKFFQIEWYYTEKGESQPYDYYKACATRSLPLLFQEGKENNRNKCLYEKRRQVA